MKTKSIALLLAFTVTSSMAIGQSESEKRVIIIDKKDQSSIGDKKMDVDVRLDDDLKQNGKILTVEKIINNGVEGEVYFLRTMKDGKVVKEVKWDGQGKMPEEIKEQLDKVEKGENGEKKIIKEKRIIRMAGDDDDDMPRRRGHDREGDFNWSPKGKEGRPHMEGGPMNPIAEAKVRLGIQIDEPATGGTMISQVEQNSKASKAGLRKGDIILKINDTYIFNYRGLMDKMTTFEPNDKAKITYLRDNKEKTTKVVF